MNPWVIHGGPWGRLGRLLGAQRGAGGAFEAPLGAAGGTWGPKGTITEPKGDQNGAQKGPKSEKKHG